MTTRVDFHRDDFDLLACLATVIRPAAECPDCQGEGYHYVEQTGRHREHPIAEIRCDRCGGTGLVRGAA